MFDNADRYQDLLENAILPDCSELNREGNFIFQQDGATSHTANKTQRFLMTENINFIKKNEWPPMSPDLNPMDYAIWPALRELVYCDRIAPFTEEELIEKIRESWNKITIELIRNSVSSWKKRLRAVIQAGGYSTEHLRM